MRAAANLLALCLLALASLPARCQHGEAFTGNDQAEPMCTYRDLPEIQVYYYIPYFCPLDDTFSGSDKYSTNISVAYGTEVQVVCLNIGRRITLSRNGKKILPDQSNDRVFKGKLDLEPSQYIFKCTDNDTTCERSVSILVTPRLEVISPNVQTCFKMNCSLTYYLQYGNSVSVLCSGADASRLVMTKNGKTLPTVHKNGTTIESFEMTPDLQISEYACSDVDTTRSTSMHIKVVPNIYFQSQKETIMPYEMVVNCFTDVEKNDVLEQQYYFHYSLSIDIFCSGPRSVKFMYPEYKQKKISIENYNETTIFVNIARSRITELITCADSEFPDYFQRVIVIVFKRLEVVSPGVRLVGIERGVSQYTIPYGQSLEIVCSGVDASELTILNGWEGKSVVQTVNKTAIKYILFNPVWTGFIRLICSDKETDESYLEKSAIKVAVLPTVNNFRCVSYNLEFINCSWTGVSNTANNTLYYVDYGILTQICETSRTSRLLSKFCVWEHIDYYKSPTFLVQSCSHVACYNQTFQFHHLSIVKLAPPEELTVLRTTSRGAELQMGDGSFVAGYHMGVDYKVQYWYPGIERREVNSSLVTCDNIYCKIELNLPCPGQLYEVRISHKLHMASEEFMSAPSSVTFYTDRDSNNTINNDPTCNPEPVKTKEVMRYFVQELRKEMRPEIQPMKKAVHALQEKLANVRKYIASIKKQDGN